MKARLAPAILAFIITLCALVPSALSLPQNGDESQYAWTAAYYGGRLTRFDFQQNGTDELLDPGWSVESVWATTQPMGTRFTYAIAMALTRTCPPEQPYDWSRQSEPQPLAEIPSDTLLVLRITSIVCASLGLAMFALKWGWYIPIGSALVLLFPSVRDDLALARAEGQLMLGFGLLAITAKTRWFPVACALAASFKLTALIVWPLLLIPSFSRWSKLEVLGPACTTLVLWSLINPPSWFVFGPGMFVYLAIDRILEFSHQSTRSAGLYSPTRYFLQIDFFASFVTVWLVSRGWHSLAARLKPEMALSTHHGE
jgi:hypothetical protein